MPPLSSGAASLPTVVLAGYETVVPLSARKIEPVVTRASSEAKTARHRRYQWVLLRRAGSSRQARACPDSPAGARNPWRKRGGGRDCVDTNPVGRVGHSKGARQCSDTAFGRRVAVDARYAHQRHIRHHVDDCTAAILAHMGYREAAAKEGAPQVDRDDAPELVEIGVDHRVVARRRPPALL